ncbi:hypothetical protein [Aureibacter tunicatorum]|uniref:Uncharacterized protein n=1 Tax=Aureibacter tunicatorum TaxID=866807 RepID=A0AAE3XLF4_9BACT|nr:hypothetical protein [Aureibacter tunicatorum]MDR6240066.1 hypothetical protein [Aureibacter tunicatorum]BDD04538.1 hypothetical protein AUTU_20210 [Aureibacter tunicatorum]
MKFRLTYILFLFLLSCSEKRSDENHVKILKESWNKNKDKEQQYFFSTLSRRMRSRDRVLKACKALNDYTLLKRNLNLDDENTGLTLTREKIDHFLAKSDSLTDLERSRDFNITSDHPSVNDLFEKRDKLSYYNFLNKFIYMDMRIIDRINSSITPFCGFEDYTDSFRRRLLFDFDEHNYPYTFIRENMGDDSVELLLMDLNKPMYTVGEYKYDSVQIFDSEGKSIKYDRKKFKSSYFLNFHAQDTGVYTIKSMRKIYMKSEYNFFRKDTLLKVDQEIRLKVK